ncbi:MAG: hypothetical protein DRO99_03245 [Candidatus Aenigmatarchaeota archaeon]|nr:MAG: hypothetical protein DRO99_03245 [Candidatus Aenigmarchaeota archaeon]
MNKSEMVKMILDKGMLISPSLLERLSEETLTSILKNGSRKDVVLDAIPEHAPKAEAIEAPKKSGPQKQKTEPAIRIEVVQHERKENLSPEDFVKCYNDRYEKIRRMLLKKTDAISINKIRDSATAVTSIGIVREKTPTTLIIEDTTGEMGLVMDQGTDAIEEDDVIAATGHVREGKMYVRDVKFPDIPLSRHVAKSDIRICFSEEGPSEDGDILCSTKKVITTEGKEIDIDIPATVTVEKGGDSVTIVIYKPGKGTGMKSAVDMLKKRHLSTGRKDVRGPEDSSVIDRIPDVFWLVSEEKGTMAYKGVTIVSCSGGTSAMLDMSTRKVDFIDKRPR